MGTKSRETIYGSSIRASAERAAAARKEADRDGYTAVQLGAGQTKAKNVAKPQRGHFAKAKLEPKKKLVEFRVSADALLDVGAEITAAHFLAGQFVDPLPDVGVIDGAEASAFLNVEENQGARWEAFLSRDF